MAFTHSKLSEITVGSGGLSTITLANIPQNYDDLKIVASIRGSATPSYLYEHPRLNFNISGGNYKVKQLRMSNSSATSDDDSSGGATFANWAGLFNADNTTASTFSNCEYYIPNYRSSNQKSFSIDSVIENNANNNAIILLGGLWTGTSPINSVTLTASSGNFLQHSTFTLYGVKAEV